MAHDVVVFADEYYVVFVAVTNNNKCTYIEQEEIPHQDTDKRTEDELLVSRSRKFLVKRLRRDHS